MIIINETGLSCIESAGYFLIPAYYDYSQELSLNKDLTYAPFS